MFEWHAIVNVCMASLHKMTESCHDGHVLGLFSVLLYTIVTRNQGFVSRWLSRCLKCGGCGVWIWFRSLDLVVVLGCRFEGVCFVAVVESHMIVFQVAEDNLVVS